jgi:hypothetical protein
MADDTTQAILAAHAAILDNLAAGQLAVTQTLQALVGVVQLQQDEGSKTSKALTDLAAGVRLNQSRMKAFQEKAEADRARMMAEAGIPPR